ncbi:hypothetical protein C5167_004619 [Papaver somniferum]|uniref:WRC domain-containing protein n=1 Tax=Papaver somniferum TaxID=3469 RepID=A0A4Y7J841_PAPSO|nr:uncharacterized protein DDB_G0283697-like [Papaver somniferum]RZC57313.1 hypothetical protein C5167_004619 [Papaver somniferum]
MRIRKLIAQKKISEPNSNVLTPSPPLTPTKTIIPSSAAAADVSTSSEEEERVNNFQEKEVVVCELNMSLWDVIPVKELRYYLPKKVYKAKKKGKYDDKRIRDESVNADGDRISILGDDIEPEDDDEEKTELVEKQYATAYKRKLWLKSLTKKNNEKRKRDCNDDIDNNEKEKKKKKKKVVYCCKTVGEGWHCRSKAQIGSRLCKHHLIQMQRNSDHQRDNNNQEKKIQKLEKKTARRGRPPKESSTNTIRGKRIKGKLSGKKSSEFYYYSGFGPLWGKNKRGRPLKEVKKQQVSEEEDAEEGDAKVDECVKLEEKQEIVNEAVIDHHRTSPKMNIVKEENVDGNDDNGCMFVDDDFDDSEDSDEDCNGVDVKKRYRKPIKARSLASLFSNT